MTEKSPSFLLRYIGKEPGTSLLNWLEISRSRSSLRLQMELTIPNITSTISVLENNTGFPNFDCPFHCPELNACIDDSLWCDGYKNCPSGYDELENHCNLKYKMMRNYVILTSILIIILVLTVFVLVATIRRFRYTASHIGNEMLPRRITTEETLYDQSNSTISS